MIELLRIEQLALVDRVELEFGPGLNVVTGETGAGKSVVLGALGLLAGARTSAGAIREGADQAVVEAVFRTDRLPELEAELAERGLPVDDHELVVRRTLARSGRSRAQVGGCLVPISALAELFAGRIEISSQHQSQALLRLETQSRVLDEFGGLRERCARVRAGVSALGVRAEEIARLRSDAEERVRREDFLAFQVGEIDDARLEVDEVERISAEHARLVHAERLRSESEGAVARLTGDPARFDTPSATDLVGEVARVVEGLAELDPALAPLVERLWAVQSELGDAAGELERYAAGVEADPARLTWLEERIAQIERLRRKYGATAEEILAYRDGAARELASLSGSDDRLRKLESEREAEFARVEKEATALGRGRRRAAKKLATAVEAALGELAMSAARFEVDLRPVEAAPGIPCGPNGAEAAEFLFSANAGESARSLRRVASGGELSRVFLALKNVLRRADAGMVLIFDEVDAAIGGRVADRVGAALGELSGDHQVLCITHLPQIAARGQRHFRVAKFETRGRTKIAVDPLDPEQRIEEIARMAGGEVISEATRRHARSLLSAGRGRPQRRG
jgi:DNA repair protein RecN (Recombination protein N)